MAIQNDPRLYSGGSTVVNSQPTVNIYAQHLQRKQAREEALDAYEMNRINRMNEQGVRDIDRPGLDAKVIDMKTYYQANKDKIRKGGTPEAYNYEKMFRDTLAGVSASKNATAEDETFGKLRQERKKDDRNTPAEWFDIYSKHQQTPVWDEHFEPLPLSDFMELNAPAYDPQKTLKGFSDIKKDAQTIRYENIPGDRFNRNKFIDENFSPESKEVIRLRSHDLYDKDGGLANAVKNDFSSPIERDRLEKTFIKEYGAAPQSMGDYAAAKILSQLQPTGEKKPIKEELWKEKQDYMQQYKQANIKLGLFLRGVSPNTPFDLTNYPITDDGQYDITEALKGVSMNRKASGESRFSTKVLYNPKTQVFTYVDPVEKQINPVTEKPEPLTVQKPFTQFIQDVKTNNPGMDMKFVETLQHPIGTRTPKNDLVGNKPSQTTMVTVVLKDGRTGQIPSDKVAQFLKDNPGSKKQ